jgi:NADH-quinone oxidoreductase subunit N
MDFSIMRWELAVGAIALLLLLVDIFNSQIPRRTLGTAAAITLAAVFLASLWNFGVPLDQDRVETAYGLFVLDRLAIWGKQFAMLGTLVTMLISLRFLPEQDEHYLDYLLLQLLACVAMMLVVSTQDFFSLFVSLELMTICFYVLVSFSRRDVLSLEAGVKYLVYGALASGILLYGIALIYGATGEVRFSAVAEYASANQDSSLLLVGLILVLVGLGFKISAVPFHWWTADVYEGSPTPTAALLSIGSKGASFVLLIRVLFQAFPSLQVQWIPLISIASAASILFGNLGALSQTNLKRLMGYSSISHTGYMLLGIATVSIFWAFGRSLLSFRIFVCECSGFCGDG